MQQSRRKGAVEPQLEPWVHVDLRRPLPYHVAVSLTLVEEILGYGLYKHARGPGAAFGSRMPLAHAGSPAPHLFLLYCPPSSSPWTVTNLPLDLLSRGGTVRRLDPSATPLPEGGSQAPTQPYSGHGGRERPGEGLSFSWAARRP